MSNQYNANDAKKTQNWLLYGGIAAVILFTIVIFLGKGRSTPKNISQLKPALNINATVSDNISDTEVYTAKTEQEIRNTKDQINDLQSKFQAYQVAESNSFNLLGQQFAAINAKLEDIKKTPVPTIATTAPSDQDLPAMGGKRIGLDGGESDVLEPEAGIMSINLGADKSVASGVIVSQTNVKIKKLQTYLPTSFVKGKLITSLSAPCGGTAQDNPFPVLINVTGNAQLPNNKHVRLKGCFVLAAGYGDIASERAYLRLEKMSCVTKTGAIIDQKVEGYIAGEDGKAGLRGKLVSKAGSKVALALLSGTVGGLAQAFAQTATTLQQTPIGPTQTVTPSQSLGFAGASGVSSGFQQLSQYYINMAEKTFPVIEINDQRNVTIIFTQGIDLPVNLNDSDNVKQLPIIPN